MNRPLGIVAASLSVLALFVLSARQGQSQVNGSLPAYVRLQAASPGTAQPGHSNITGTAIAAQFVGGGGGITNVNANLLDGLDSTAFLQAVPNPLSLSGSAGVNSIIKGNNTSTAVLSTGVTGEASGATGTVYGVLGTTASTSGRGVAGFGTAATGTNYGGYFDSNSTSGYGVYANSAGTYGLYAQTTGTSGTNYGIYGKSPAFNGVGVFGEATSSTGANYGGRFWSSSTAGTGVSAAALATSGSTFAGRFENNSTSGRGVFGWALATSGNTYGVWGKADSPTGIGGYFQANNGEALKAESAGDSTATFINTSGSFSAGAAVVAEGNVYAGKFTATSIGIDVRGAVGVNASAGSDADGVGVQAYAGGSGGLGVQGSGSDSGVAGWTSSFRGVWGDAFNNSSLTHYGVYGEARSPSGRGVYGIYSNGSGTGYGVRGVNSNAGYAVYALGDMGASGTKSFVIDHPFDPANKYLKHYCAEGPEPKNIYDGTVVTDANGWATVVLPDYFMEINKDPRVQLTAVDSSEDFVMVKRVGEFMGNTFRIRTSKGRVKVDWEVKATRNDAWVRTHGAPVEVQKDPIERGKYQHPEFYGKPKEMGVDFDQRIDAAKSRQAIVNARR